MATRRSLCKRQSSPCSKIFSPRPPPDLPGLLALAQFVQLEHTTNLLAVELGKAARQHCVH
jgi:hypothetical protein